MTDAILSVDNGDGPHRVSLSDYLDADHEERAVVAAYAWIKRVKFLGG